MKGVRGPGDIPTLSSQVGRVARAPESQHPVLGLASVRILTVRVGLASTGHLRGGGQVREASRGLVGLDTSAHVLRLMDLGHKSSVGWEIQRPSRSMSMRGFTGFSHNLGKV